MKKGSFKKLIIKHIRKFLILIKENKAISITLSIILSAIGILWAVCIQEIAKDVIYINSPPKAVSALWTDVGSDWYCRTEDGNSYLLFGLEKECSIRFFMENINESQLLISDIYIDVTQYQPLPKIVYAGSGGLGAIFKTYYYNVSIEPNKGKYSAQLIGEENDLDFSVNPPVRINDKPYQSNYVNVSPQDSAIFVLFLDFEDEGIYNLSVDVDYVYHGKEYSKKMEDFDIAVITEETFYTIETVE